MLRAAGGGVTAANGIQILGKSAVPVSCPADTTEDVLATITIPANSMGANGYIRYRIRFSQTNNVNAKTARLRIGGISGTDVWTGQTLASQALFDFEGYIANAGATNSQRCALMLGATSMSNNAIVTAAVDTTAATTIVITGQKATAGDALTLESYMVELMYGA